MVVNSFKRYELKYLLTKEQFGEILKAVKENCREDGYGKTAILNIYYDTPDKLLVRRSIEKPFYKEKLRLRSYGKAAEEKIVFLEIKKKYDSVVYKRRETLKYERGSAELPVIAKNTQIADEIKYFVNFYKNLEPSAFISYSRAAYFDKTDTAVRVTFDKDVLYRTYDFDFLSGAYGKRVLPNDKILMEVKVSSAVPLWLTAALSQVKAYKTTFSKYGAAYADMIKTGGHSYANVI